MTLLFISTTGILIKLIIGHRPFGQDLNFSKDEGLPVTPNNKAKARRGLSGPGSRMKFVVHRYISPLASLSTKN